MASFQKIVLVCAIIIFILTLILISYALVNAQSTANWPPLVGDCPDYWIDTSGNGASCVNVKNLGTCPPAKGQTYLTMDFTTNAFTGSNASCAKYKWANSCGVSWDGVNYGVSSPC
jgi:hypothetical protein